MAKLDLKKKYLLEVIDGRYDLWEENRLSQIFCATFNNSRKFQKIFFELIGYHHIGEFHAETKKENMDIWIYANNRRKPKIVIENKIEAELTPGQLRKYNKNDKVKNAKKIALVKFYFPFEKTLGWKIIHWVDLYGLLIKNSKPKKLEEIDAFLIGNLLNYLEVLQMSRIYEIKKEDLKSLTKAVWFLGHVSNKGIISLKNPIFKTADDYINMIESVIELTRNEPFFKKRIGKNFQFTPYIGWNQENEGEKTPWIGVEITLSNKHKSIKHIGTGINFIKRKDGYRYDIMTYAADKDYNYIQEKPYGNNDLKFEIYSKQVILCWKKWLK